MRAINGTRPRSEPPPRSTGRGLLAACVLACVLPATGMAADVVGGIADEMARDAVIGGSPVGTPRVIGGGVAEPGRWPSIVALVRSGAGSPADRHFCGGTVIAPRWIMTAAHCLYDAFQREVVPSDIRVIGNVHDLRADRTTESVVTSLFIHPEYDHVEQDAYNDIALIEMANELDAPVISLFDGDVESLGTAPGTIVGWGATEFETPRRATYPDVLHEATVPLVSRATCNDPMSYAGYISPGQLCAGLIEGGVDTCVGDSGGPLFVETREGMQQVGVVSYGRGCAEPFFYGIYANVAFYRGWIGDYVELPGSPDMPDTLDSPRGPGAGGVVIPDEAPVARPVDTDPVRPVEPIESAPVASSEEEDDRQLFGGAAGLPGLIALAFLVRRRRRPGRGHGWSGAR